MHGGQALHFTAHRPNAFLPSLQPVRKEPMKNLVYKIVPRTLWQEASQKGVFEGAPIDVQDGFIHFSTAAQARETARRHFTSVDDLLLVAVEGEALGEALRYEPSRGGDLFPHLYADLPIDAVLWERPLPLGDDGEHVFPEEFA
jgi:uncharacterized protein (DUF952 family)